MILSSPAFKSGKMIPAIYTCDGSNVSPPLEWRDPPERVRSFALICDDPDAPGKTWVHWVLYNIPSTKTDLMENMKKTKDLNNEMVQGGNDFGNIGYSGPCPPPGTHRYFFKLYALDVSLPFVDGITKERLLKRMEGHILSEAELMGRYSRKK